MHEYGIAQQMLTTALQHAQAHQAARITRFRIEMSRTAGESEDSLRFYLESLTPGTAAEGAQFEIQRVPVSVHCLECGQAFEQADLAENCPHCHSPRVMPDPVDEFKLSSIEVE